MLYIMIYIPKFNINIKLTPISVVKQMHCSSLWYLQYQPLKKYCTFCKRFPYWLTYIFITGSVLSSPRGRAGTEPGQLFLTTEHQGHGVLAITAKN